MNKKLFILAAVLCLVCSFALMACSKDDTNGYIGTYYEYEKGQKTDFWIKLDKDAWSSSDGAGGRLEINGEEVTAYADFFGEEDVFFTGTVKDGVLTYSMFEDIENKAYKDGAYKSGSSSNDDNTNDSDTTNKKTFTVTFDTVGGSTVNSVTVSSGDKLTAPSNPVKQGYIFGEWYTDKECKVIWDFSSHTVTKNITLYAKWVEEVGKIVSVENAKIENENIVMIVDKDTEYVSLAGSVSISGSATWKLYYDRMGQTEIPTKIAAQINGSLKDGNNIFYIVTTTSDGSQVRTYTLNVHKRHPIQIYCYVEGSEKLLDTITVLSYTSVKNDQINEVKCKGYTINGWTDENDKTVIFGNDGTVFVDSAYIYAKTTPNRYKISYDARGGEVKNSSSEVTFDSKYTLDVPTKTGYSFLCWAMSVYDSQSGYSTEQELTFRDGLSCTFYTFDKDITAYAKYEVNSYNVNVESNDNSAGTVFGAGEYNFWSDVTVKATTNDGYTWLGWYDGDTKLTDDLSYTFNMPSENKTYTAIWIKCPVTLTKNIDEAGTVSGVEKTVLGKETTITASTNNGYTWKGWYDGDTKLTDELFYTFNMPSESKTFTAKFEMCTAHTPDDNCVCTKCEITAHAIKNGNYCRHDNDIYFGSYPQTKVTDNDITTALNNMAGTLPASSNSADWTAYGYYIDGSVSNFMWYIDKEYNGEKYRGVYFTSYRPYYTTASSSDKNSNQDDNGYYTSTVYWFKYEPIKWTILNETDGKALILADLALDSQQYYRSDYSGTQTRNGRSVYANDYVESDIRKWLNDTFYNTAFNDLQKALIETTAIDNKTTGYNTNTYNSNQINTEDKIFLLSYKDVFSSYFSSNSARQKQSTDYAKSQGCYTYNGNCYWWLRSPDCDYSYYAFLVLYFGDYDYYYVYVTGRGVVPALTIRLG